MSVAKVSTDTVILGAGPAGTGPLICAIRQGKHTRLLDRGVIWVERGTAMGGGSLGNYDITSDTASSVFLECLQGQEEGPLKDALSHPMTTEVRGFGSGPLPLPVAARYLTAVGEALRKLVDGHATSKFYPETTAERVELQDDGSFIVQAERQGVVTWIAAKKIVFALGGAQSEAALLDAEIAGGIRLKEGYAAKTIITNVLVTKAGQVDAARRLTGKKDPRVVILGSSHSAITSAWIMLQRSGATFSDGGVTVLCKRKPKVFYPTVQHATDDGYTDWNARDICPVTGRVYRLSGLRLAARDLVRSVCGLGTGPREHRMTLETFSPEKDGARIKEALDAADVIVPAFGYAPRTIPTFRGPERVTLFSETRYRAPLVDGACRVRLASGGTLPGAFAMGLASGFVPHGDLGGEPSFDGQTNGLWLYQNGIGEIILDQLLETRAS